MSSQRTWERRVIAGILDVIDTSGADLIQGLSVDSDGTHDFMHEELTGTEVQRITKSVGAVRARFEAQFNRLGGNAGEEADAEAEADSGVNSEPEREPEVDPGTAEVTLADDVDPELLVSLGVADDEVEETPTTEPEVPEAQAVGPGTEEALVSEDAEEAGDPSEDETEEADEGIPAALEGMEVPSAPTVHPRIAAQFAGA